MNKKLLALAVTSALAGVSAEVSADTANVNVYGKIWVQAQTVSGKGSPTGAGDIVSHQEIADPNSYIGFKGEDNIGGGLKGWFQIEQTIQADDAGASSTKTPAATANLDFPTDGNFSTRNSAVGLSGGFGNVFLGRWDTVYKQLGDPVSFLGISSGNFVSTSNVLSKRFDGAGAASFHLRRNNYIEYDSPNLGGLTVMAGYSPDEARTGGVNKNMTSIGVKFEQGPLYVALANERHNDFFAGTNFDTGVFQIPGGALTDSKDTATRISAKYALPTGTTLGIDVSRLEYQGTNSAGTAKGKNTTTSLVATQALGNITLAGGVVTAGKFSIEGTDLPDSDAMQLNLGVGYALSKRTQVYAIYSKLKNKDNAAFNNTTLTDKVNPGVDPEEVAVGIAVSF